MPVEKTIGALPADTVLADRTNMAHAGAVVSRGSARAVVVATGVATQLGEIQRMVAGTEAVATPLTRKRAGFATQLSAVIVAVAAVTFTVGLLRGMPLADAFTAVVALAVGVVRTARRNAVVRHLPAVETPRCSSGSPWRSSRRNAASCAAHRDRRTGRCSPLRCSGRSGSSLLRRDERASSFLDELDAVGLGEALRLVALAADVPEAKRMAVVMRLLSLGESATRALPRDRVEVTTTTSCSSSARTRN